MDLSKKYRTVQEGDNPALGNFVHYYLYTNKIKKKGVSDGLNISYHTFNRYLKNTSFQFTILWRISKIVNYNFLMDLGERLNIPYETKAERELKAQLELKTEELEKKEIENRVLLQIARTK